MSTQGESTDAERGEFKLIETLKLVPQAGFALLDGHVERLIRSAETLGFACDPETVCNRLGSIAIVPDSTTRKVRLTLSRDGAIDIASEPLEAFPADAIWQVTLSKQRLDAQDPFLRHKTTARALYDGELARLKTEGSQCRETIFLNHDEEVCEGCFTNVFVSAEGSLLTPPLSCGLLPGVLRQHLLETGQAREQVLSLEDLQSAEHWYVGNSVRGLIEARLSVPS